LGFTRCYYDVLKKIGGEGMARIVGGRVYNEEEKVEMVREMKKERALEAKQKREAKKNGV
jgi:hypothetical protein